MSTGVYLWIIGWFFVTGKDIYTLINKNNHSYGFIIGLFFCNFFLWPIFLGADFGRIMEKICENKK